VCCDVSSADEQQITAKIHTSVRVHAFIGQCHHIAHHHRHHHRLELMAHFSLSNSKPTVSTCNNCSLCSVCGTHPQYRAVLIIFLLSSTQSDRFIHLFIHSFTYTFIYFVFMLRCHVSGFFMSCNCRGVRDDFIVLAFIVYLVCALKLKIK